MWEAVSAMGDNFTNREIMEAILEIKEKIARMEERLTRWDKVEDKADEASETANKALSLAEENQRNLDSMKKSNQWSWGLLITLAITLLVEFIKK
jgi:hypothetical protein